MQHFHWKAALSLHVHSARLLFACTDYAFDQVNIIINLANLGCIHAIYPISFSLKYACDIPVHIF